VEVKQIDQIRYCVVFNRIAEGDSGEYSCRAVNPLGEAICEATFEVKAGGEGSGLTGDDLYLPELWKAGRRLTWKDEDARYERKSLERDPLNCSPIQRLKPFANAPDDPALTPEDIASMTKRIHTTPLPKAMEYFASLPDYQPTPLSAYGLKKMPFSPESGLTGVEKKSGKQGGSPSRCFEYDTSRL